MHGIQETLEGVFNWAAKGRFFLRGGGGCMHSIYHKTLSPTITWHKISCESETIIVIVPFWKTFVKRKIRNTSLLGSWKKGVPFLSRGCIVTFKFHHYEQKKNNEQNSAHTLGTHIVRFIVYLNCPLCNSPLQLVCFCFPENIKWTKLRRGWGVCTYFLRRRSH